MKNIDELEDYFTGYLAYYFGGVNKVKIESKFHYYYGAIGKDAIAINVLSSENELSIQAVLKVKTENYKNFEDLKHLNHGYSIERFNKVSMFVVNLNLPIDRFLNVLDELINDLITLIDFSKNGDIDQKPPLPVLKSRKIEEGLYRASIISFYLFQALKRKERFFELIKEDEFDKHDEGTRYCFNDKGQFLGYDLKVPPNASVIIKTWCYLTKQSMITFAREEYEEQINILNNDLEELYHKSFIDQCHCIPVFSRRNSEKTSDYAYTVNKYNSEGQSSASNLSCIAIEELKHQISQLFQVVFGEQHSRALNFYENDSSIQCTYRSEESEFNLRLEIYNEYLKVDAIIYIWDNSAAKRTIIETQLARWFLSDEIPLKLNYNEVFQNLKLVHSTLLEIVYDFKYLVDLKNSSFYFGNYQSFDECLSHLNKELIRLERRSEKITNYLYENHSKMIALEDPNICHFFDGNGDYRGTDPVNKEEMVHYIQCDVENKNSFLANELLGIRSLLFSDVGDLGEDAVFFYRDFLIESSDKVVFQELYYPQLCLFLLKVNTPELAPSYSIDFEKIEQ